MDPRQELSAGEGVFDAVSERSASVGPLKRKTIGELEVFRSAFCGIFAAHGAVEIDYKHHAAHNLGGSRGSRAAKPEGQTGARCEPSQHSVGMLARMEDLTDAQIETLHTALEALKVELSDELNRETDTADIVDLDKPMGRLSRVDAMQQQKMAQAQRARVRLRLGQVGRAIAAVDDDEYGDCKVCGEAIGLARLTARPEAHLCIECTEASERRRRR